MFFISSDQKKRHRFIDNSIEATAEVLSHERSTHYLGAKALLYGRYLDNLYVPNQRHGTVMIKDANDRLIPILALKPGESIMLPPEMGLPSRAQRARMTTVLQDSLPGGDRWTSATTDEVIAYHDTGEPLSLSMVDDTNALVRRRESPLTIGSPEGEVYHRHISGRPTMALMYPNGDRVDPSAVIHELEHVAEGNWSPLKQYEVLGDVRKELLRGELLAYHVQSMAIQAMVAMGYEPRATEQSYYSIGDDGRIYAPIVGAVEDTRRRVNAEQKDKFLPSDELIDEFARRGIEIISL